MYLFVNRFFYKRIWRAWDSDIAKDEPYASQCLQSRMALHYDLEEGKVNPEDQVRLCIELISN